MKIGIMADLHLRGKDLDAASAQLDAATEACAAEGVELLCLAGDIVDKSNIYDAHGSAGAVLAVSLGWMRDLKANGIDVLAIPGNHDVAGANSVDALHMFDGMTHVWVEREPRVYSLLPADSGSINIACIPWSWRGENAERVIAEVLATIPDRRHTHTIIMAHVQVTGARMSGAFCCPDSPGKFQVSRAFLESLEVDHIALGDFHARQDLANGRGGYVGALRQLGHGDEGNPAGFEIYDTTTGLAQWIELDAAPRYRTIEADEIQMTDLADPRWINRVKLPGAADPVLVRQLENSGVQVDLDIIRPERVTRAAVAPGIMGRPHDLVDLFASTQNQPWDAGRLAAAHRQFDVLHGDKAAVRGGLVEPASIPSDDYSDMAF